MRQALADFRIENDGVVKLSFANGQQYRVSPDDLERCLRDEDLVRVRQALLLRKQFLRRMLPPLAAVVLVAGIVGLAGYDASKLSRSWQAPTKPAPQAPVAPKPIIPAATKAATASGLSTNSDSTTQHSSATQSATNSAPTATHSAVPTIKANTTPSPDKVNPLNLQPIVVPLVAPVRNLPVVKGLGL